MQDAHEQTHSIDYAYPSSGQVPPRDKGDIATTAHHPLHAGRIATSTPSSSTNTDVAGSTSVTPFAGEEVRDARESPILRLPPELISHLLSHIPAKDLQRTALSLHKVFPDLHLAEQYLWKHVVVKRAEQLMPLWRAAKVRKNKGGVKSFTMESWMGDADILNKYVFQERTHKIEETEKCKTDSLSALRCLSQVPVLILNMGTNFAPEHLEEMFEDPRHDLKRLELRFRPYVAQASYYQFLKGSYFDTAIETLARTWPETPSFTQLSIVQDPPPRGTAPPTALHSVVPSTVASPTVSRIASASVSAVTSAVQSVAPSAIPSAAPSAVTSTVNSPRLKPTSTSVAATATAIDAIATPATGAATVVKDIASSMADLTLDSSSDTESSGYSTPPTSQSDTPAEPKGYSGHGPFPFLGDKLAWARPKSFAQPIVFFDIKCIARFGVTPVARHLTHLRLRVPSRDLASVLIMNPSTRAPLFPAVKFLDISTTNVRLDHTLSALFKNYEQLEHLVMDRVNLFGFQAKDKGMEMCRELGGMVLSAGLARGKERERLVLAWDVNERTRMAIADASRLNNSASASGGTGEGPGGNAAPGGASATGGIIQNLTDTTIGRARRGHRSMAHSTFSFRDRPSRLRSTATSASLIPPSSLPPTDRLYLVLPPLPTLRTLCIGGEAHHVPPSRVRDWTNEFHSGWREGLGKVMGWAGHVGERYERARKKADEWLIQQSRQSSAGPSSKNEKGGKGKGKALPKVSPTKPPTDVRLFRFPFPSETPETSYDPSEPTTGLVELFPTGKEYLDPYKAAIADAEVYANDHSYAPPCVLCTVPDCEGPARRGDEGGRVDGRGGMEGWHVERCGHELGRRVWGWEGM